MDHVLIPRGKLRRPEVVVICFAHAGGNAHTYQAWQAHLPETVGVVCYQPAGRGSRVSESPARGLPSMVAEVLLALKDFPDVPYVFFGHSFGGLLAFEVLKALHRQARPVPAHFIASASMAPPVVSLKRHRWANLDDDRVMFDRLVADGGVSIELIPHREAFLPMMPSVRAEFGMMARYEFEAHQPFDIPLTLIRGRHDTLVNPAEMRDWKILFACEANDVEIDGDHFFVDRNPREVIEQLRAITDGIVASLACAGLNRTFAR